MQTVIRNWLSRLQPWARPLEVLAWTAFFALALLFLSVRFWLLPRVESYHEEIVAAVSRPLGLKVAIGAIEADWRGLRPRLTFTDVRIYDRDGREALVLPVVENTIAWGSLLLGELRMHALAISGPRLRLRRDAQGAIFVAGIRLEAGKAEGGLADWILGQREIEIRNAEIDWVDEQRGAPPLALAVRGFRIYNDGDEHSIGLSALPPSELGSGLELRAQLVGRTVTEIGAWNGRVYAELGYTDLAGWRKWVDYPVDVRRGEGAVRVWASLGEGRVTRAAADVQLTDVVAKLGQGLPVLEISSVRGRLQGRQLARGYEFGVRDLALASGRGPEMQTTSFRASWEAAEGSVPQRGSVVASLIELGPLAHLAEFLPFPADLRRVLAEIAPQGNLLDLKFDWTGELPDDARFSARARFEALAMHAWRAIPGFAGLSGSLDASEAKGSLQLASRKSELDLPKVFPEPRIALDGLAGEIRWEREGANGVAVRIASLNYANEHFAGTAFGSYRYTGEGPGEIDLSAQLARADGRYTAKYLPLAGIMGAATRDWLARAIREGSASDVRLRLRGDLRDFPYTDPAKGEFLVAAHVLDGVLEYAEGWPRIEGIDGELLFERDRMEIKGHSGSILGAKLANVNVGIDSLRAARKVLIVQGNAAGPTAEFLRYIQESPVRAMIDGFTDGMSATGSGRLQLRLDLPLGALAESKIAGDFQFTGNNLIVHARLPAIERLAGQITFTESALTVHPARGQLFGGPVTISGSSSAEAGMSILARGEIAAAALRPQFGHPWLARLSGSAPYTASVSARKARTLVSFESSLRGIASELPPPLAKAAGEALPLRLDLYPASDRERISFALGNLVAAEFLLGRQGERLELQRAAIALGPAPGEAVRVPERREIAVYGALPAIDLSRWLPLYEGQGGALGAASVDLRIGTLDAFGKRLTNVVLRGGSDGAGWSANVRSSQVSGDVSWRPENGGRIVARLAQLTVPEDSPGTQSEIAAAQRDTGPRLQELSSLDFVAERFEHDSVNFGRVEVAAQRDGADWRISKLAVVNPEGSLAGSGGWRIGADARTSLKLSLESSNLGKLLERFGRPDRVVGGTGKLEGTLSWSGSPLAFEFPSLSGELSLSVEKGQFPQIQTGFGRVLSLVSLNLSEATAKGYQFDSAIASLQIAAGVLSTKDMKVRSAAAEVSMAGNIDLAHSTQDLHVKVVPSMRRGVTAAVGLLNPVIGVGVAVAQGVLQDPVGQLFTSEYHVTGGWNDPHVEKLPPPPSPPRAEQVEGAAPPMPKN